MVQYSASVLAWLEEHPQPDWVVKYPSPPLPDVRTTRYNFVYFGTYRDIDVWWDTIKGTSVRAYKGDVMGFTQFGDDGENVKYWIDIWAYNNWRREEGIFVPPTPLIPTGYEFSYTPPDLSEPPWPFNWIKGVFQGANNIASSLESVFRGMAAEADKVASNLEKIGGNIWGMLKGEMPGIMDSTFEESIAQTLKYAPEFTGDSPEWKKQLDGIMQPYAVGAVGGALAELDVTKIGKSPLIPEDAAKAAAGITTTVTGISIALWLAHAAAEAASLGQYEAIKDLQHMVIAKMGLAALSAKSLYIPLNQLVFKRTEHFYASLFTPEIPPYDDLINMRVKEKISQEDFKKNLAYQGYSGTWADRIWQAHFQAPSYSDIVKAYYRGGFSYERLVELMKRVDLDPEYNEEVFLKLIEEIPPYSELVNERVKEVLTQKEFDKYIKYYGFDPVWASRIWDAHFTPAAFADFLTAMRRKETVSIPVAGKEPISHTFGADAAKDAEIIKNLSILADYDPRYWDFFKTRIYNDPTPRMARWAFEVGALTPEQVAEVVHRFGYRPEDEQWFTNMLIGFQERPWVTKYLTAISTAYIRGAITEEELKKRVVEVAGRNEKVAEWIVEIAKVKLEIATTGAAKAPKLLGISDLKKAFLRDKINEDVFRRELGVRGYEIGDVDILVQLLEDDKTVDDAGGRVVALSITQMLNAWRYNVIGEDELRTKLMLRGLSQEEVTQLIDTKKKQWGVSPPS